MFIWFLPPFKQYGTKYFYFFLVLCFTDPIIYLIVSLTHIKGQLITPFISLLMIYCLLEFKKKNTVTIVLILFSIIFIEFIINAKQILLVNALIHIFILIIIINDFLKHFYEKNAISIFFLILIAATAAPAARA